MLAPWRKNFKSRRYAHVKMMWGEASNRAALTGDLGAGPESMSTSEGRLFYVSAGKSAFNILGLFQQYRPRADVGTWVEVAKCSRFSECSYVRKGTGRFPCQLAGFEMTRKPQWPELTWFLFLTGPF